MKYEFDDLLNKFWYGGFAVVIIFGIGACTFKNTISKHMIEMEKARNQPDTIYIADANAKEEHHEKDTTSVKSNATKDDDSNIPELVYVDSRNLMHSNLGCKNIKSESGVVLQKTRYAVLYSFVCRHCFDIDTMNAILEETKIFWSPINYSNDE